MEEPKPKMVQTIGLAIVIISGIIIVSNGISALAFNSLRNVFVGLLEQDQSIHASFFSFMFDYYEKLDLVMIALGVIYLIGGVFLRKFHLWANRLITVASGLVIVLYWGVMIALSIIVRDRFGGPGWIWGGTILSAISWSIPMGLLIRFLNRNDIKAHFV